MWREAPYIHLPSPARATPFQFTWWWLYDSKDAAFHYNKCGFCSLWPTIYITMVTHCLLQLGQEVIESNSSSSPYLLGRIDFPAFVLSANGASWRRNQFPCSTVLLKHRGQPGILTKLDEIPKGKPSQLRVCRPLITPGDSPHLALSERP